MRFKDFEIHPCVGINAETHDFELVKYKGGYCYVVAWLDWDSSEPCWEFSSVGTRFLEDYEEGLSEWIMSFLEMQDVIKKYESD